MPDPRSRARVERLIRGDIRQDDLMGLFLFARDRCDGRAVVSEIGHFVAHHSERDKGLITRETRNWYTTARYLYAALPTDGHPKHFTTDRMPKPLYDFLKIATQRIDAKLLTAKTGMSVKKLMTRIDSITNTMSQNVDRTWRLSSNITKQQIMLIQQLSTIFVVKPAFKSDDLVKGFLETLKSQGLISNEEIHSNIGRLSDIIALFAVSVMHNSKILLHDDEPVRLYGGIPVDSKSIAILANVPIEDKPNIGFSCAMFDTGLDADIHCSEELRNERNWEFEVELSSQGQLVKFGS